MKIAFKPSNCTKIILLWQIPNVLPKSSCLGALVLKPRFLGLYAPLRIPSKRKRLLLVKFWNCQRQNTCVLKKTGKLKTFFQDTFTQACTSRNESLKSVICLLLLSITQQHYTLSLYQKVLSAYQDTVV